MCSTHSIPGERSKKVVEPLSNISVVCSQHHKPRPELVAGKTAKDIIGWFVKLAFDIPPRPSGNEGLWPEHELMWLLVIGGEGDKCIGELNNDPFFIDKKCGDCVEFSLSQI